MNRVWSKLAVGAALAGWLQTTGAVAQPPPPLTPAQGRPVYSPYLNLLRPGGSPALNYYGLVRPEIDLRRNINGLQQDLNGLNKTTANLYDAVDFPATGHSANFLTQGKYFNVGRIGGRSNGSGLRAGGQGGLAAGGLQNGGAQNRAVGGANGAPIR